MARRVVTRWKHSVRRRLAIAGAVLTIGVLILFVAAVLPASAHTPLLSGHTVCSNGDHVITWSIGNDYPLSMSITSATATKGAASYGVSGYASPVGPVGSSTDTTSATTTVPGNVTGSITLTVHAQWTDGFTATASTSVTLIGPCMGGSTTTTTTTIPSTSTSTTPVTVGGSTSTTSAPTTTAPTTTPTTAPPTTAPPTTAPPTTTTPTTAPVTTTSAESPQTTAGQPQTTTTAPTPTTIDTNTTTPTTAGDTTTSIVSQGSTVAPPTTLVQSPTTGNGDTPITAGGGPSGGPSAGPAGGPGSLPFTGISALGPLVGAASVVIGGIALAFGSVRNKRRERV